MSWRGLLLLGAAAAAWAVPAWQGRQDRLQGQAMFRGEASLPARLVGHEIDLPAVATRCGNCHEAATPQPFATPLGREQLMRPRVRRGGPPSSYDAARLCQLLRDGVDPAHVMISTTMPRYEISPLQCSDLWAFLVSR